MDVNEADNLHLLQLAQKNYKTNKKIGVETIFTVKFLVHFTNNDKELTRNTLNVKLSRKTEIACSCTPVTFSFIKNLDFVVFVCVCVCVCVCVVCVCVYIYIYIYDQLH